MLDSLVESEKKTSVAIENLPKTIRDIVETYTSVAWNQTLDIQKRMADLESVYKAIHPSMEGVIEFEATLSKTIRKRLDDLESAYKAIHPLMDGLPKTIQDTITKNVQVLVEDVKQADANVLLKVEKEYADKESTKRLFDLITNLDERLRNLEKKKK